MNGSHTHATPLRTGHVGLNVTDLSRSLRFYQEIFGFRLAGRSEQQGREYAALANGTTLVLTLWQQSTGAFDARRPGLHHLSFEADSIESVRHLEERVRNANVAIHHGGIVPHHEGASSGGLFFEDPDGTRLEVFAPSGVAGASVPTPGAPTCGFF